MKETYGFHSHPYFIYAPRWIDSSAGIKALHYLCHSINMKGDKAFLVLTEAPHKGEPRINHQLMTPILTQEISDAFFNAGVTPIVIYSETIPGNPLGATCIVRYLMNFTGVLGGPEKFNELETPVAFSKRIAQDYANKNNQEEPRVLFLPPIDPRDFIRNDEKRSFQVVYAGKYRSFVGKPPKVGKLNSVEIYRDGPRMQSRDQVKKILSEASVLYSFENSSIVSEAILSGTPAYFVPNDFLGEIIADIELGMGGLMRSDTSEEYQHALETIDEGISEYSLRIKDFQMELEKFVQFTQDKVSTIGFREPIIVPVHAVLFSRHRVGLARQIILHQGLKTLTRVVFRFMLRRLSWRFWMGKEKNGVVE